MNERIQNLARGAVAVAIAMVVCAGATRAASPEGRWRMVEQSYGDGSGNTVREDEPRWLELRRGAQGWSGELQSGSALSEKFVWPAVVTAGRVRPLEQVAIRALADNAVEALYRVPPTPGDDLTLEIRERYRLDGPDRLLGLVEVTFERDGVRRGGYTLRRRYARER